MQNIRECLLIDDDLDDQEIFQMCLKKVNAGINCTAMNNAVEAISMLISDSDYTPAYIFIDMNMPKMNGIECLRALKDIERLNGSKIFMYSTTAEKSALDESKKLGVVDFIIKPAKTAELKEKLSQIFGIASGVTNIQAT